MLAAEGQGQVNGRVREAPNDRLIRWYATIGLVDPPLSRAGRIARYGRRHLLQLVAIKRRQAAGLSLAEIQAELVGATDSYLASVAALPPDGASREPGASQDPGASQEPGAEREDPRERAGGERAGSAGGRFWAAAARPHTATRSGTGAAFAELAEPAPLPEPLAAELELQASGLVQGLRLAPGVVLLLDAGPSDAGPSAFSAAATELRAAAAPLLRALARHGYLAGIDDLERKQP